MTIRTEQRILVRCGNNLELPASPVVPEPSPARTLDSSCLGVQLLLERVERPKVAFDSLRKGSIRRELAPVTGGRRKVGPEEGVVDVSCIYSKTEGSM